MAAQKQVTINVKKGGNAKLGLVEFSEGGFVLSNPDLAIDTNFDIQNTPGFDFIVGGKIYSAAAGVTWDTGAAKDITIDQFAAALLSIDIDGTTATLQWAAEAATSALAIDALDALTPTGDCVVGYVVVQTKDAVNWVAGTDALTGGTGGDVALSTLYVNLMGWVK